VRAEYDIVVVGAGGAGLACAVRAAELGADVLVLEPQPSPGGSTARAVGSFTASGTEQQRRAGIEDSVHDHKVDARWVLLGPVRPVFTTTEGGAAINASLQVLDTDDRPIPGLFAAGQNGLGGMVLWGHGLHIGWALTSGRLVGEALGRNEHANSTRGGTA
jgi:succinate dehydrogenase/fumarate reductase flavoprotein subunit